MHPPMAEQVAPRPKHGDIFWRKIMNLDRIANVTSSLNSRPSRRDVLRGLVGTGLGLAALRLPEAIEARKKRKKRKKGNKGQTCQPGTSIGTVSVPASGAMASSPALVQGQRYRLRATGFWNTNATHGNDAFASFPINNPGAPVTVFQGVRLGLSVDGGSPDQWGSYNITHNYEREIVGQGAPLSLRYTDPATSDNSGSLTVNIVCA
jgi:hypothetical protein